MSYKVLYIDDDDDKKVSLETTLCKWNDFAKKNKNSSYLPMEFAGLSWGSNSDDDKKKMYYVDTGTQVKTELSFPEQDELEKKILAGILEKITKIQPDAILLDIHLGDPYFFINGGKVLNKGIRKYYPYMPVVMVTKRAREPEVESDWKESHLSSEGVLCFPNKRTLKESYDDVCKLCSVAINYRGIPIEQYKTEVLSQDPRLPVIFWKFIQEFINSQLFNKNNDSYPIIFLHGVFGSGRRLFALWMNALLQKRRQVEEPLPSSLTEINCACFSTSSADDSEKQEAYLKDIFQPSEGKILFLTDVDKVPDCMQEVFKKTVDEWKKNTCIIVTTTDSKHIGLARLPKGIREIESYDDWKSLLNDPQKKNGKDLDQLVKEPQAKAKNLIAFLNSIESSIETFTKNLDDDKINYEIVDCSEIDYTPIPDKEKRNRLEKDIKEAKGNCIILVLTKLDHLNCVPPTIKEEFKEWVGGIRKKVCMIIGPIEDSKEVLKLLGKYKDVTKGVKIEGNKGALETFKELTIAHNKVYYFPRDIRTGGIDFEVSIKKGCEEKKVKTFLHFDCTSFYSFDMSQKEFNKKFTDSFTDPNPPLLVLGNVDRVPDKYMQKLSNFVTYIRPAKKEVKKNQSI